MFQAPETAETTVPEMVAEVKNGLHSDAIGEKVRLLDQDLKEDQEEEDLSQEDMTEKHAKKLTEEEGAGTLTAVLWEARAHVPEVLHSEKVSKDVEKEIV